MASKTDSTITEAPASVDWASVIGAITEIGDTLGRMREAAFSESVNAMAGASERVTPFIVSARRAWRAEVRDRIERNYTADAFITTATAAEPRAWGRFGKVDGKRTASNLAAVRFVNFALHHSEANEAKFKSYSEAWDFDAYCDWLPTAWRYTSGGNLIKAEAEADAKADAKAEVKAEVSADTRMFSIDVNAIDVVKNASSAADRLVELRSLMHDAQAQYKAAYDAADKATKSVANTAYKARFNSKTSTKIAAGLKAKGYAD